MRSARLNSLSKLIVCSTLAFGISATVSTLTNYSTETASASPAELPTAKVIIDGKQMAFQGQGAVVMQGATLVPMREVFSKLGATLSWNQGTKTVTAIKGPTKIVLTIGKQTATVNGNKVTLTKEAVVLNGATLVPLRFISEALGAKVSWDQKASIATITSAAQSAPTTPAAPTTPSAPAVSNTGGGVKVGNLFVKYGTHTYESKTQAEYDKVMEIVANNIKDYKTNPFYSNQSLYSDVDFSRGVSAALSQSATYRGEKIDNYWKGVMTVNGSLDSMREHGVPTDLAVEAYTIFSIGSKATQANSAPSNSASIRSAYQSLVEGLNDCDSWANALIAHYDAAGFNTQIRANSTHATGYVQINNAWYSIDGGLNYVGTSVPSPAGTYQYTAPTF